MSTQLENIWQRSLELLKDELTPIGYNTWILTIEPVSINSNTLVLSVPADFNKNLIESRYSGLIKNAVTQAASKEFSISYVVSTPGKESSVKPMPENTANVNSDEIIISVLNPKYTFDTFVIGNGNRLAQAASLAVAEAPSKAYNPLFIYGGSGLGKTHLMHAIGNYILSQNSSLKVLYVTSENFTNELINAIKNNTNEEFRQKYRNIDIMLIDDIQFIGGRERTQEEFFHTFNTLYEANKQIILTSDKHPREINTLEERLRSRFEWGLTADIQPPDIETRIAILRKRAQLESLYVPNDIMVYIAENIATNIRLLEGALNKVVAYSSLTGQDITIDLAVEVLKDALSGNNDKVINSIAILEAVARYYDIKPGEFKSKKRSRDISYPRQIAMYLCRDLTGMSLPQIGGEFGGRDHTTVIHAIDKIKEEMEKTPQTKRVIEDIKANITGK